MNLNNLNNLMNSPSFRGGEKKMVEKATEVVSKEGPKLLEILSKTLQQILRG